MQKISPIKQRILQYVEYLNISKRDFYAKTGISRGTLESNTGITEDIMAKFIATYPEINVIWLIKGEGSMTIDNEKEKSIENKTDNKIALEMIRDLAAENALLKKEIKDLTDKQKLYSNIAAEPEVKHFTRRK